MSISSWKDYQKQHSLIRSEDGKLRYADVTRLVLVLPPELVSTVFTFCLPDDEFIYPDPCAAPLVLLQICTRWRWIAITTPALWTSLYIDFDCFHNGRDDVDVLLCDWISRSGSLPLSIKIADDFAIFQHRLNKRQMKAVFGMVGKHSARWQDMCFVLYPEHSAFLFPVSGDFPVLRKLIVECQPDAAPGSVYPSRALDGAYMLRELRFHTLRWPDLAMPWNSVELYCSDDIGVSASLDVLRNGINLIKCSLSLVHEPPRSSASLPPRASLQELTLVECANDPTESLLSMNLLRNLTLPSLKHLTLKFHDASGRPSVDVREFVSFVTRSSIQLESLTLCLVPGPVQTVILCLRCLPSLVTLRLQPHRSMTLFLAELAKTSDVGGVQFLPRLESLHLVKPARRRWNDHVASEIMLRMLSSRWDSRLGGSRTHLRTVHFNHAGADVTDTFTALVTSHPTFERLQEAGMTLVFGKSPCQYLCETKWWVEGKKGGVVE
ncbi:hypothetical protein FB45DRAFT_925823 [Roridomyces roridus]|uniref:F-box domain-containing protein n=1 Tax=Roridomyces roridus TaxID=1738132 RepID=A0AAD7BKK2_9AGAR|nr:hypothetical protein FB45DRAFT_925823 [Roridomyces roridus]